MKRPAVDKLVYTSLFPRPKQTDPHSFLDFLERYLVLEVRQEVHSFYGHLDTQEAKYPGLNYSHPTHRVRLSRWPWHRRLFRAFDSLGLTPAEIANLTKWEGTKWAKERYEKEQSITILDTAADGMPDCRASRSPSTTQLYRQGGSVNFISQPYAHCEIFGNSYGTNTAPRSAQLPSRPAAASQFSPTPQRPESPLSQDTIHASSQFSTVPAARRREFSTDELTNDTSMTQEDDSDGSIGQSIDMQFSNEFREQIAPHQTSNSSIALGDDWEQWLKTAIESGDMSTVARQISSIADYPFVHTMFASEQSQALPQRASSTNSNASTITLRSTQQPGDNNVSAQILEAARHGNWAEVPQFLHNVLRNANQMADASRNTSDDPSASTASTASTVPAERAHPRLTRSSTWRPTYSELRLPRQ
ncbi:hypothetical protein F503_05525 [Ophiostoma piceae UAMH 11346]|uniref:Uncharacterized protein n=1 Tax=Ophiostoma piceae (strain UAMH 11346) TaxID=1262450 RepID=S3DA73_OPHP1|nr:hypothetical protein F503_05525 [Ophiostoma piceae UAMH 11346]